MEDSGYELALLASKRLRTKLLKVCGVLLFIGLAFSVIVLTMPAETRAYMPASVGIFFYLMTVLPLFGAVLGFATWVGITIRAAIFGVAVDDVIEQAQRKGLLQRDD
jgi:hypothetical protein